MMWNTEQILDRITQKQQFLINWIRESDHLHIDPFLTGELIALVELKNEILDASEIDEI